MFYLLGLALPYVHFMFLIWVVFEIFTPIMGRSGTEIPPEVVLASLVTLATIFLSSFFVSIPTIQASAAGSLGTPAAICLASQLHFIYLVRSTKWILTGLGSVFLVTFLVISSGLLFPYSGAPERPRPKRVFLQVGDHTSCLVFWGVKEPTDVCFRPAAAHHSDLPQSPGPGGEQGLGSVDQQLRLHGHTAHHPPRSRDQRHLSHPLPRGPPLLRVPLVPAREVPQQVSSAPSFSDALLCRDSSTSLLFQEELVPACSRGVSRLSGRVQPAVPRGDQLGDRQNDLQSDRLGDLIEDPWVRITFKHSSTFDLDPRAEESSRDISWNVRAALAIISGLLSRQKMWKFKFQL